MLQKTREATQRMKRGIVIGGMLLAVLVFFMSSIQVEAVENTYTYTDDQDIEYTANDDGVTATVTAASLTVDAVVIPAEVEIGGSTYKVTTIGEYAFDECDKLSTVNIDYVTTIGEYAFARCTNLEYITIPASVTTIGEKAFMGCTKMVTASIQGAATIGENAFEECTELTTINMDQVTIIGENAFEECSNLESITIPASATSIGKRAFYECGNLESVDIQGESSIGEAAFGYCTNLTTINMDQVISIGDIALIGCEKLESVTIPASITSIGGGTFFGCFQLTTVTIAGSQCEIGDEVFWYCTSLETITVSSESLYNELVAARDEMISSGEADTDSLTNPFFGTYLLLEGNIFNYTYEDVINSLEIIYIAPVVDDTQTNTTTTTTEVATSWVPTDPADIYRFSLIGAEDPSYKVLSSMDSISIVKDVQGPLFFDAVAILQGDYTLARTYNIFVNNALIYSSTGSTIIVLDIPESLQKDGRTFCMFCVTEDGAISSLPDLDSDPTTITFETDKFYAFTLGYVD